MKLIKDKDLNIIGIKFDNDKEEKKLCKKMTNKDIKEFFKPTNK